MRVGDDLEIGTFCLRIFTEKVSEENKLRIHKTYIVGYIFSRDYLENWTVEEVEVY